MNNNIQNIEISLYFTHDSTLNSTSCNVVGCKAKPFKGFVKGNLLRHLKTTHKQLAACIGLIEPVATPSKTCLKGNKIEYNSNTITQACVSLCTKRGLPFSLFDYPEIKFLFSPTFSKYDLIFNSRNIIEHISHAATEIKSTIVKELDKKFFALKFDSASRNGRSILGVNCQYISQGEIKILTLSMEEIFVTQSSENLKNRILSILASYNLSLCQVIAITTDNGANMLKSATLLQEEQALHFDLLEMANETDETVTLEDNDEHDENNENETREQEEVENERMATIDNLILQSVNSILHSVRCAAHSFQLAVLDVIKKIQFKYPLERLRQAAKTLRTPRYRILHQNNKIKKPPADVVTRWGSSYLLMEVMQQNKNVYQNENLGLMDNDWEFCEQFLVAFKPVFILTKQLQAKSLLLGDLFKYFLETEIELKKIADSNIFKQALIEALSKRKSKLFDNTAFRAALYFDKRFTYKSSKFFPKEHIESTIRYILMVYEKIIAINVGEQLIANTSNDSELRNEQNSELEMLIQIQDSDTLLPVSGIECKLREFLLQERLHSSANVMDYWKLHQYAEPELYKLAEAILCIPATQVSVERSFSSLPIILRKNRPLGHNSLSNVLMVRLNHELLEEVKFAK